MELKYTKDWKAYRMKALLFYLSCRRLIKLLMGDAILINHTVYSLQYLKINVLSWMYSHRTKLLGRLSLCLLWVHLLKNDTKLHRRLKELICLLPCKFRIISEGHFITPVGCYAHFISHIATMNSFCKTRMFDSAFDRGDAIISVLWD